MIGGGRLRSHGDDRSIAKLCGVTAVAVVSGFVLVHGAAARTTATTLEVCKTGTYQTIQSAVDKASNGDTIEVCAGMYTEQVTIPATLSNVTLSAASKGAVIKAPPSMAREKAIVEVAGAKNITIKGFTIQGPGGGDCGSIGYGVEVDQRRVCDGGLERHPRHPRRAVQRLSERCGNRDGHRAALPRPRT